ncbi:MAG: oxygen-independent coproporphyrinogen III oxidase [Gammaproteobacteria bacterium RBG_16_51_14]|nr:MAG: oxygen-independent coproporphyrinogen III oxidase [Gammaproteobacteria bacterium RBG_16_51_14]
MDQSLFFDKELIRRYDKPGPRYTSYPAATQFHENFLVNDYIREARCTNQDLIPIPLSLYFHLPFCDTVCYYCACNKIVTRNRQHAIPYLNNLHREIEFQGKLYDRDRMVDQLHWGGGTPTFISHDQMCELMDVTRDNFTLRGDDSGEYSIEIDPREVDSESIPLLRKIGFNRISIGIQDFDPTVQKAVNRIQPYEQTADVIKASRDSTFRSISVDLIYGLPLQSVANFRITLEKIVELSPDRVAIYNYAHLPHLFKTQKQINESELPSPAEKLGILQMAINTMIEAGYVYIGMDHFAKPDDELALAQRDGNLYRNFQGYSTHANCDVIGMGISSISRAGNCYAQNVRTLDEYVAIVQSGEIPIFRGYELNSEDKIRRDVIAQLICHFSLDFTQIESQYEIDFKSYFSKELEQLSIMHTDGLLLVEADKIQVLPIGRLLIRNICTVFDQYMQQNDTVKRFSKMI